MSASEARLLSREQSQASTGSGARMPAWKREILERRRAKSGGAGPSGALSTGDTCDSPALPQPGTGHPPPDAEPTEGEKLVLQESLGSIEDNPFIRLEKERKKRQERDAPPRSIQHILEAYGNVPGIKTIRADNIIIIESDPSFFQDRPKGQARPNGTVGRYNSINDLLERRGSPVTEIRAREVVIYDTALSRSEENLSLVEPDSELGLLPGQVSRLLQKFDRNYGKLHQKSHSTEDLLADSSAPRPKTRLISPLPKRPHPFPATGAPSQLPSSPTRHWSDRSKSIPVFQQVQENHKPSSKSLDLSTRTDVELPASLSAPTSPQTSLPSSPEHWMGEARLSVSSFRKRFEPPGTSRTVTVHPKERGERKMVPMANGTCPHPPGLEDSEEPLECPSPVPSSPSASARGTQSVTSRTQLRMPEVSPLEPSAISPPPSPEMMPPSASTIPSSNGSGSSSFEIRRAPKPDLSSIPEGDLQAKAIANIRIHSRNSFTVIPNRARQVAPRDDHEVDGPPSPVRSLLRKAQMWDGGVWDPRREKEPPVPDVPRDALSPIPQEPGNPEWESDASVPRWVPAWEKDEGSAPVSPAVDNGEKHGSTLGMEDLPVTNIDDIVEATEDAEPTLQDSTSAPGKGYHQKTGNTFTVVPKRKPATSEAVQEPADSETPLGTGEAPFATLGAMLKKRYPAAEEIQVIGGYQSLGRSCLSKSGTLRKKLKISFNDSSLQTTFEYPSESSLMEAADDEEEEEEEDDTAGEEEERLSHVIIPRPTFTNSPSPVRNSADLSTYMPKHSMNFSTWQEQRLDKNGSAGVGLSAHGNLNTEEMLTPADVSSLSDFHSEPALYF
ncbi:taperin [Erpetoichthys calabaricus]|uniref:taperin n=1 Tax=Erpetoichthys calabaricus TaxID=27687 RepID=UPI0022348823|nr:taperin [Erpetoichthys calabaricus]